MPLLGRRDCVPVGPSACADGFEPDPSGWGCRAILPTTACTGATREAIGSATCVPVGDCTAPFPPAGAIVVDDSFADAELGPRKFKTISDAIASAGPGDVVAIEAGTYADGIVASSNITVVGRCAAEVRVVGSSLEMHGVLADGAKNVVVKGVTLVGHFEGARAMRGGDITMEDVVIERPRMIGFIAWNRASRINFVRSVVRDVQAHATASVHSLANADEGGTIELLDATVVGSPTDGIVATNHGITAQPSVAILERTVIRDVGSSVNGAAGVVMAGNARGEVIESAVVESRQIGVMTSGPDASLTVARSEIRDIGGSRRADDGLSSGGVFAFEGTITLDDTSIHQATQAGILAYRASVSATGVVVRGTRPGADGDSGTGAYGSEATLSLARSALIDNAWFGAYGDTTALELREVLVQGTHATLAKNTGMGVGATDGAEATLDGVTVIGNDDVGVIVHGELEDGRRTTLRGKRVAVLDPRTGYGNGMIVEVGGLLELDVALVRGARQGGIVVDQATGGAGSPSELALRHGIVRGTRQSGRDVATDAMFTLDGFGIGLAGNATIERSLIVDNEQFGIVGGRTETTIRCENIVIASTQKNGEGSFGHGILAVAGSLGLKASDIHANEVGLVFSGATAVVSGVRVQRNAVGIHVQGRSSLQTGGAPPSTLAEGVVFVADDSEFIDNTSRTGAGALALPSDPLADVEPVTPPPPPMVGGGR